MISFSEQWRTVVSKRLDLALLLPALALSLIGYIMITSASMDVVAIKFNDPFYQSKRQLLFMFLGSITLLVCLITPVHVWQKQSPYLFLNILALILIMFIGTETYGATRWIRIAGISLQPSEFIKVSLILCLGLFSAPTRRSAK